MTKLHSDFIWLTGSRKTIKRMVYKDNDKFYIKWYGNPIEVIKANMGYTTVESY